MLKSQLRLIYFPALQGKVTITGIRLWHQAGGSDLQSNEVPLFLILLFDVSGDGAKPKSCNERKMQDWKTVAARELLLKLLGIRVNGPADWEEVMALLHIFKIMSLQQMGCSSGKTSFADFDDAVRDKIVTESCSLSILCCCSCTILACLAKLRRRYIQLASKSSLTKWSWTV